MNHYLKPPSGDRRHKPIRMGDAPRAKVEFGDDFAPLSDARRADPGEARDQTERDDRSPRPGGARRAAPRDDADAYRRLPGEPGYRAGYRPVDESRRGPMVLALAVGILALFGFVVWNAYRDGVRPEGANGRIELADAGPFKSRPERSDQPAADSLEASVFDQVEPGDPPEDLVGGPSAAEPVATPELDPVPEPVVAATEAAPPVVPIVRDPPAPLTPAVQSPPPAPETRTSGAQPARGGPDVVQLAAVKSEADARAEWARRAAAAPDLYARAELLIQAADVNGQTVYRVRAQGFADRAEADAFCAAVKFRGGDCFRTVR
ncbi:hypothetical protein GC169_05445 [bacterium]|nr:hypothetical protein [bacterium]